VQLAAACIFEELAPSAERKGKCRKHQESKYIAVLRFSHALIPTDRPRPASRPRHMAKPSFRNPDEPPRFGRHIDKPHATRKIPTGIDALSANDSQISKSLSEPRLYHFSCKYFPVS